jgi:glyoxylase-like metal-dependent hydrolase (beta-lactamase superfamily II)
MVTDNGLPAGAYAVPSAKYPTIQSAIDDASLAMVSVAPGSFKENLVIARSLKLVGAGADSTMIDGGKAGVVVTVTDGADVVIEGFTITGGDGTSSGGKGGGISIRGAVATIRNNAILDNVASRSVDTFGWGGGVCVENASGHVRIEGNQILNNVAFSVPMNATVIEGTGGGNGGGIAIGPGSSADIGGNTIRGNLGYTRGDDTGFPYLGYTVGGGGIYFQGDTVNIDGNTIDANYGGLRGNVGHGGAINVAAGIVNVVGNTITRNTALNSGSFGQGGGINATGQFRSLTIAGNHFEGNTGVVAGFSATPNAFISSGGGGLHVFGRVAPPDNSVDVKGNHFIENVVARSIMGSGGQGAVIGGGGGASYIARCNTVTFEHNEVRGNVGVEISQVAGAGAFGGAQGGGSVFQALESVRIDANEFRDNIASRKMVNIGGTTSSDGGGFSVWRTPHAVITNNTVVGNVGAETVTFIADTPVASYVGRGGGIYVNDVEVPDFDGPPNYDDTVVIRGNKVVNNVAVGTLNVVGGAVPGIVRGGGIYVGNVTTAEVTENEVLDNSNVTVQTPGVTSEGADIALYGLGTTRIADNTTHNNRLYSAPASWLTREPQLPGSTVRFKIGAFDCVAISDGTLPYDSPTGFLFGYQPKEGLEEAVRRHKLPEELWIGSYTCLLIDTGTRKVLVDTGPGRASPSTGLLPDRLKAEGISREDIDTVIITHAHPDHIGGIVGLDGMPMYPNACYVMSRKEWEFWTSDPTLEEMAAPDFLKQSLLAFTSGQLPMIKDHLQLVEGEAEVAPGIRVIPAAGHTPGQVAVLVASEGKELLYMSDVVLHPIHLEHPDWFSLTDFSPDDTLVTRRRLLDLAAEKHAMVMAYHCDFPSFGRVARVGAAWSWQPAFDR